MQTAMSCPICEDGKLLFKMSWTNKIFWMLTFSARFSILQLSKSRLAEVWGWKFIIIKALFGSIHSFLITTCWPHIWELYVTKEWKMPCSVSYVCQFKWLSMELPRYLTYLHGLFWWIKLNNSVLLAFIEIFLPLGICIRTLLN